MFEAWIASDVGDLQRAKLAAWAEECSRRPGELPADCRRVKSRLVRAVGKGVIPGDREVYLKVMGFPRGKDRLRYLLRPLPAVHEAKALLRCQRGGIACPQPLYALASRRWGQPRLSFLAIAGMEVEDRRPPLAEVAALAARMAKIGLFHPDLNPGNFLPLVDGSLAVIDLQSARWRRAPLRRSLRIRMAAKLWAESLLQEDPEALVVAELIGSPDLSAVLDLAEGLRIAHLRGRILRCLRTSSEFRVRRHWNGVSYRRRVEVEEVCLHGGGELRKLWIGDRVRQVLDAKPPIFTALFMKSWWLPGRHSLYYPRAPGADIMASESKPLLEGYRRFHDLAKMGARSGT